MIFNNIERPFLIRIYFNSNDYGIHQNSDELPVFFVPPTAPFSQSFGLYISDESDIKHAWECFERYKKESTISKNSLRFLYICGDLCRQTDVLKAASATGYPLVIEKGAFLSPDDIKRMIEKLENKNFALVECGSSFGYANRVLDPRSLYELKTLSPCFGVCLSDLLMPNDENYSFHPDWLSHDKFLDAFKLATESFKPNFYVEKVSNHQKKAQKSTITSNLTQKWDGSITNSVKMGRDKLTIIAGPCMLETLELGLQVGSYLKDLCAEVDVQYVFKSSFDKANRTSASGVRGPGLGQGVEWLAHIKNTLNVPILTDVHSVEQAQAVANVADILQIPAFLCRDQKLLLACAQTNKVIQIKKGQWLSAQDMINIADFLEDNHFHKIILAERGSCFGYNNLVVDFKNIVDMHAYGHRVVFDATHATQLPGAKNGKSSGLRHMTPALAHAAVAVGIDGLFMEVHPNPENALSDADTQISFKMVSKILKSIRAVQ